MGLPWCGIKNPPSKAGDVGLIPGLGTKIPYAVKQLRPCAAAARETHMSQKKEPVHHREIPHAEMKIQYSQKKKRILHLPFNCCVILGKSLSHSFAFGDNDALLKGLLWRKQNFFSEQSFCAKR